MSEQSWYYVDTEENPQGPLTGLELKEMVESGVITRDTAVWTEETGDIWIPAGNVDGLFSEDAVIEESAGPQVKSLPEMKEVTSEIEQPKQLELPSLNVDSENVEDEGGQSSRTLLATKPVSSPKYVPKKVEEVTELDQSTEALATEKKVNYTFYLSLVVVGYLVVFTSQFFSGSLSGELTFDAKQIVLLLGLVISLFGGALGFLYTSRAWEALKPFDVKTPNVWLLCVPVFNCFWAFKVFADLAKEWEHISRDEASDTPAPPYSLMLWHASGFLVGFITWGSMLASMYISERGGEPGAVFSSLGHPFTVFMTWSVYTVVSLVAMRSIANAVNCITQSRAQDNTPREIEPQLI